MFSSLVAEYYITLLNIHPFREGNGRTIREFLSEFVVAKSKELGLGEYELDWSLVDEDAINAAIPLARVIRSPIEYEIIKAWLDSGANEDLIKEAFKEATYNGVSNLRYIDKIIYEWGKKGFKTMDDVNNYLESNRKDKKSNKLRKEEENILDYDWLG